MFIYYFITNSTAALAGEKYLYGAVELADISNH